MGLPAEKDKFQLQLDRGEMGKADTLRYNILTFVIEENYERAVESLRNFLAHDSDYPNFHDKIERYIFHAVDLVNAIRAKRKFPGAKFMTMAKQQELNERFREHFLELQGVLKRIEKIQVDLRIEDVRSTVWVVRSLVYAVVAIVAVSFIIEVTSGLAGTAVVVADDSATQTIDWIFNKLHL